MTKIVYFYNTGKADVLKLKDAPLKEPEAGEVRIQVKAIGLNRAEVMFREGAYLETPQFPARIGYEAAGIVDAVGVGVEQFQSGDRVSTFAGFSMSQYGVYGESAIVPVHAVAAFPSNLSFAQGAAIWMSYLTAYGALFHYGQIKPTDFVLISAATSSVGLSAIQLAKTAGATIIATTRTSAKKQALLKAGADFVIATQEENLESRILEMSNGHGADLIFDAIAGAMLESLANAAAVGATIFVYGALSSETVTPFPMFPAIGKGLKIQGYTMGELQRQLNVFEQAKQYIYEQLKSDSLKPVMDSQTFPLNAIADAHRYMESNRQNGKIIVTV